MVDAKKIAFNPAVELSYLRPEEQTALMAAMDNELATPSLSQALADAIIIQAGKDYRNRT